MMSFPAINHLQYRLTEEGPSSTRLELMHRAMGVLPPEHREGMAMGFQYWIERVKALAEGRAAGKR